MCRKVKVLQWLLVRAMPNGPTMAVRVVEQDLLGDTPGLVVAVAVTISTSTVVKDVIQLVTE